MVNAIGRCIGWAIVGLMAVSVDMVWARGDQIVSNARLLGAGDHDDRDWLSFGQDYRNQRFSALDQIDRETVARLQPAWIYQTGVFGSFQSTPLVVDGGKVIVKVTGAGYGLHFESLAGQGDVGVAG